MTVTGGATRSPLFYGYEAARWLTAAYELLYTLAPPTKNLRTPMIDPFQSLAHLISALESGRLRARELAETIIAYQQASCETLNSYRVWDADFVQRQAVAADAAWAAGSRLGPLQGIPVSAKDHFGVRELPVYAGTVRELPAAWRREGPVVTALRRQLAIISGKTHAVELAFGGIGLNNHSGTPRNPWDGTAHRVPGGSSSGAGVSLWAGTAWLALGTDTAGSVRIPASVTGCVGLKTSFGRWSTDGIVPLSTSLDTAGLLGRSVADVAYGFAALDTACHNPTALLLQKQQRDANGLRIGIAGDELWRECDESIASVVRDALDEAAACGARLIDSPLPEAKDAQQLLRVGSIVSAECDAFVERELPEWRPLLDPIITSRIADGDTLSARDYLLRRERLARLSRQAAQRFGDVDVIAAPTVPIQPPRIADVTAVSDYRARNMAILSNTCSANYLGLCAITMPAGLDSSGLPVGLMLLAPHGAEERLLTVALRLESVLGTALARLGRPPLAPKL